MTKNKATEAAPKTLNPKDTTASNQRAIVIHALRTGAKTTIELRDIYGVLCPAPRVFELKLRGYKIVSTSTRAHTADGVEHVGIARYALLSDAMPQATAQTALDTPANDATREVAA